MARVHENNYESTLASPIDAIQTSITVSSDINFPNISPGDIATLTIDTGTIREIVYVTAKSGTTLTVIRGRENTTAQAFIAGTKIEQRLTADTIDDKLSRTNDLIDDDTMLAATSTNVASAESIVSYIDGLLPQSVRAWGTYDQSVGLVILDSFNIASISDDSVGKATITLSTPMANDDYVVVAMGYHLLGGDKAGPVVYRNDVPITASSFGLETARGGGDPRDIPRVSFAVIGNK